MNKRLREMKERAVTGDAEAQFNLGEMYYNDQEYKNAARWITEAANQGSTKAQSFLGKIYKNAPYSQELESGDDYWWDPDEFEHSHPDATREEYGEWFAEQYDYLHAGENDEPHQSDDDIRRAEIWEIQFYIGLMYFYGTNVAKDYKKAFKWWCRVAQEEYNTHQLFGGLDLPRDYKEAALSLISYENIKARFILGTMYFCGQGVQQNSKEAVERFTEAAEEDNGWVRAAALAILGEIYLLGSGVAQDYQESIKWTTIAAEYGYEWAQYNLGCMYKIGEGIQQNSEKAFEWYTKAAEQGLAVAQYNLGLMFLSDDSPNYIESYKWFYLADVNGVDATKEINNLRAKMTPEQIAEAEKRIDEVDEYVTADEDIPF